MESDNQNAAAEQFVQCYLVAVKRPRAEFHHAALLVEREIFYIYGARTLVDGWRDPQHVSATLYHHVRLVRHFVFAVGAVLPQSTTSPRQTGR